MNEQTRAAGAEPMPPESEAPDPAQDALAPRHAHGEIMTYELDCWIVREYPGGFVERSPPSASSEPRTSPTPTPTLAPLRPSLENDGFFRPFRPDVPRSTA